jgi:hypothetical protein
MINSDRKRGRPLGNGRRSEGNGRDGETTRSRPYSSTTGLGRQIAFAPEGGPATSKTELRVELVYRLPNPLSSDVEAARSENVDLDAMAPGELGRELWRVRTVLAFGTALPEWASEWLTTREREIRDRLRGGRDGRN